MKLSVLDISGKETSKQVELSDEVFGIEPNEHAIYMDVKQHLANRRQGTHKSKERAEVAGSGRKIKKQKGTGTARAGDIKNPIFRGGGRVFGPRPKNYGFKLNRNLKRIARKSALSLKVKDGDLMVIENFEFDVPKTKKFVEILNALEIAEKKVLFVFGEPNKNVYLSSRNLKKAEVISDSQLSTYRILNADKVVLLDGVLEGIESKLNK
ncbi:MAG TPA: 50S ribosomal protein L4 [Flavobacteriaceae bacterium]|nr:50S ribosomal protein L4 [Flavobacteriaceae bacterium]